MFYRNPLSSTYNGDGVFDTFEGLFSNGGTVRNTFKVGMFCCFLFTARTVAQHCLEQVPWGRVRECFISPFQVGTTSQSALKSKCLLNTNFDSDCWLSFICSRKPSCGQAVTCKCCCLSNVFALLVSNFSELLQFKRSTW